MTTTDTTTDQPATGAEDPAAPPDLNGVLEARDRYRDERDAARQRVERFQRSEVERIAATEGLAHPTDVFTLTGNEVADYLGDDGEVDPEKVLADVVAVLGERPGLRAVAPAVDMTQGLHSTPTVEPPSWSDVLKPAPRR